MRNIAIKVSFHLSMAAKKERGAQNCDSKTRISVSSSLVTKKNVSNNGKKYRKNLHISTILHLHKKLVGKWGKFFGADQLWRLNFNQTTTIIVHSRKSITFLLLDNL